MRAIAIFAMLLIVQPAFAGARENIVAAAKGIEGVLGQPLRPEGKMRDGSAEDRDFCLGEDYCEGRAADAVTVYAKGRGVTALASSTVPLSTYRGVCLGILDGLAVDEFQRSYLTATVENAFQVASETGGALSNVSPDLQLKVYPSGSERQLQCEVIRWQ